MISVVTFGVGGLIRDLAQAGQEVGTEPGLTEILLTLSYTCALRDGFKYSIAFHV